MRKILFLLVLSLSGCALHPVQVAMHGSSVLNPDRNYRSLPVEIRLYQLKEQDAFMHAGFYPLWQEDKQVLGDSYVGKQVMMLNPEEEKEIKLHAGKGVRYIGVMAVFRQPGAHNWRAIRPVGGGMPLITQHITVHLVSNRLMVR